MGQKERLKEFIKYKSLTVFAFEQRAGLSNGYVSSISKGIGHAGLNKISENFTDLNIAWLLTGQGNMINSTGETWPSLDDVGSDQNKTANNKSIICEIIKERENINKALSRIDELLMLIK